MLFPSIFSNNLVDDFFEDSFFKPSYVRRGNLSTQMNTDIKEYKDHYDLLIEMPGFNKEDIKADLKDGYLTVTAKRVLSKEDKDKSEKYLRRERFTGQCQRSFYVGENVADSDIKAAFDNGILSISFPKQDVNKEEEKKKSIEIF